MPQPDPRKPAPPTPTKPPAQQPAPQTPAKERTGPGSGAGRGNDLPSTSPTERDTRTAEGDADDRSIPSENPEA